MFPNGIPRGPESGRYPAGIRILLLAGAAAFAAVSCIERSNPFDPINSGPTRVRNLRAELQARLDSLAAGEDAYASFLSAYADSLRRDSLANAETEGANAERRTHNLRTAADNDARKAANETASPDSLAPLDYFWFLDSLDGYGPYAGFDSRYGALREQAANLAAFMAKANLDNSPSVVYSQRMSDSILSPFLQDDQGFAALKARIDSANIAAGDSNGTVAEYNREKAGLNQEIAGYNDSIGFVRQSFNRPVVTRSDSISRAIGIAHAGDTILIGRGSFAVNLQFGDSGTAANPIVVRGYPGGRTVLRAASDRETGVIASSVLILSGNAHVRFQDLIFRGASISSIKLENGSRDISFRDCVFDSSAAYGLEVIDSDVKLTDCRLIGNGKGAYLQGREGGAVSIDLSNVLIARNLGTGLDLLTPTGTISNATIADNGGDGINLKVPSRTLTIANSIIASNGGTGLLRVKETNYQNTLNVRECVLWENAAADWGLDGLDSTVAAVIVNGNFNLNPGFVDPASLDYGIRGDSPLIEYDRLRILIGYRP